MEEYKKQELIKRLTEEKFKFAGRNQSTYEHNITIRYLESGYFEEAEVDEYELLNAAVNDIDCLYSDYCS